MILRHKIIFFPILGGGAPAGSALHVSLYIIKTVNR